FRIDLEPLNLLTLKPGHTQDTKILRPFLNPLFCSKMKELMSARMIVDETSQLKEAGEEIVEVRRPALLAIPAKVISVIFHPIFVPVYVVYFLINVHYNLFASFTEWGRTKV